MKGSLQCFRVIAWLVVLPCVLASVQGAEVVMKPGVLHSFEMHVPAKVRAGEPFTASIVARDEFGNLKTDYVDVCSGVLLSLVEGEGSVEPSRVSANDFVDGVAQVKLEITLAERTRIRVQEKEGLQEGISAPLDVSPGQPARLLVNAQPKTVAGDPFDVEIVAVDAYRNLCADFLPQGGVVFKSSHGYGLRPQSIEGRDFQDGKASTKLRCEKAGGFTLSVESRDPDCAGMSDTIHVKPGKVGHFALNVPSRVSAGEPMPIQILAQDPWGNTVGDYERHGGGVTLCLENGAPMRPTELSASDFFSGEARTEVVLQKSGPARIVVRDGKLGLECTGDLTQVDAGRLHHFDVETPTACRVKDPFHVRIVARDSFGNRVEDYERTGNGIYLSHSGSAEMEPSFVSADRFVSGEANVETRYRVAEAISLTVSESGGLASGSSGEMELKPGQAERFMVTVVPPPNGFRAGLPFTVHIEARDRYNNLVKDFAQSGRKVELYTSGSGKITPHFLDCSSFERGTLTVQCMYDRAESFHLTARAVGEGQAKEGEVLEETGRPASLGQVEALIEAHRYEEAAAMLREMLKKDPQDEQAQRTLDRLGDVIEILQ